MDGHPSGNSRNAIKSNVPYTYGNPHRLPLYLLLLIVVIVGSFAVLVRQHEVTEQELVFYCTLLLFPMFGSGIRSATPWLNILCTTISIILYTIYTYFRFDMLLPSNLTIARMGLESLGPGVAVLIISGWMSGFVMREIFANENLLRYSRNLIEVLTTRDEETGTLKRGYAERQMTIEVERARRYKRPLSIMLLGPREWDELEDRARAQELLRDMGQMLQQIVRNVDIVARFDAGRFLVLLPETGVGGALTAAKRLCEAIQQKLAVDVAAGVATFPEQVTSKHQLIVEADAGWRLAKRLAIPVVDTEKHSAL
jgi:diguanylate cyclase (GGDEF)-like protein